MKTPTQTQMKQILDHIEEDKGVRFVHTGFYARVVEWRIKRMLKRIGLDATFFKSRFVYLPLKTGGVVLCPRDLSDPQTKIEAVDNLAIIAHELQHDTQKVEVGSPVNFERMMLKSSTRTLYESQADAAKVDVYSFFGMRDRIVMDYDDEWRRIYRVGKVESERAKCYLSSYIEKSKQGRYVSEAGAYLCKLAWSETK